MHVPNLENRATSFINNITPEKAYIIAPLVGVDKAISIAEWVQSNPLSDFDDLFEMWLGITGITYEEIENLGHWALDQIEEREAAKIDKLQRRTLAKALNRTRYLKEQVLIWREYTDKRTNEKIQGWRFDTELRSAGLLSLVISDIYGHQKEPVAVQLLNQLPKNPENGVQDPIPGEALDNLLKNGIATSGLRLGWNMNSPAWKLLIKMFPNAPDLSAYGHSLNAPVLPLGYWPNISIQLKRLEGPRGEDLQTDGSGIYNTDHPMFKDFIAKHGPCPFQIRGLHPHKGIFVKGAVRPRNLGPDAPAFILDWNQVKGAHKTAALERRDAEEIKTIEGMYMACMQIWNKPNAKLKACFEILENVLCTQETIASVKTLVDEAMEKLRRGGFEGLVARTAKDDERLARIVQLVQKFKSMGGDLEATQIPMVRSAIKAKLGKSLYHIAQGAGIKHKQRVCFLDVSVEPGTIVAWGFKPGSTVTTFRFPAVLAQGLKILEVVQPMPHHLVDDKLPINAVFMNPVDLTVCMQGDDDGDIIGVSDDPRIVDMFQHKIDDNIYHIEPTGRKVDIPSNSLEGLHYIREDQRGPVGLATNLRSSLLALGLNHVMAANAMSVMIQESVDKAKRIIDWSDFILASDIKNWTGSPEHGYSFSKRMGEMDEETLIDEMSAWVNELTIDAGYWYMSRDGERAMNVCAWRWKGKSINPDTWDTTENRSYGCKAGNLVHVCHDYTFSVWKKFAHEFKFDDEPVELQELLPKMLDELGVEYKILHNNWSIYTKTLRRKSGLASWGEAYSKIQSRDLDEEERFRRIDMETLKLNTRLAALDLNEIVTIWWMELSPERDNPESGLNAAFRAISTPNNPVLAVLNIENSPVCTFMDKTYVENGSRVTRLQKATKAFMSAADPQERMVEAIFKDEHHLNSVSDENGQPIALWECKSCMQKITDSVVTAIRNDKSSDDIEWAKHLMSLLK